MNLIELLDESRRRAASLAAQSASSSTAVPDLIGRAVESQMLTGLSPAAATQDPGGFQRLYQEQRNAGALMTGPLTTDWMNEAPENAALVQDEVPRVVNWELTAERLVRDATGAGNLEAAARSWWLGMRSISPSVQLANQQPRLEDAIDYLGTLRALEDQIAEGRIPNYEMLATSSGRSTNASILQLQRYAAAGPDERAAERARVAQQIAGYEDSIGYVRDVLRDYSDSQGLLAAGRTINASDVRDLRSLGEYVTITGTQGVLDLVTYAGLGVLGSAVGGPVGGATTVLTYGSLRGFSGITAEQAIQDAPYTTEEIARAQLFGSLMGLTEVALGPTARYLRGAAGRALTREAYSEVTQEVLDRVSQGYLRRVGREAGASAVEEFFQEGAQYFLQKAGVEGADFRWTDTTLLEAFNAAMAGVVGGGIIGGAFGARQQIVLERMSRELRDAGKTVQNMEELANVTQDLQLAQRSPTKFQQLAQRLGLNRVPVFYQADDLNTYFQSQNKDPITEVVKLGATAEDFEAALASGGRVAVTAEGLARAGLRGTDGDFLRDSGSFTPAGATPAEARTVEQTYNEIQQQLQEQSRMAEMAPQRRQVYDAIYGQLRAAGRPQREAEANAALSTAFFETMAARYGEGSGLDLYRRFGFRVEGPRQMARAEAAAEAAQMQIPDDVVNTITDAISQAQTGAPVTIPVTPEVTLALQTLGVPIDPTGTISADDAQRLTDALQSLEDVAAPVVAGPTLEQAAASVGMRTPEFQTWFADSKVVDDAGQPLVVYHHGSFDEQVDVPAGPMHFGTAQAARERAFGKAVDDAAMQVEAYQAEGGVWHWDDGSGTTSEDMGAAGFSDEATAIAYGRSEVIRQMEEGGLDVEADDLGATTAVYLNIRNPKRVADVGGAEGEWDAVIEQAIAEGHDGIVYRNQFEDKGSDSYIAFSPTQIKSVNNQGTFDPNDPRILFQGPLAAATPRVFEQTAYHGSPHLFEKFLLRAIGTGEGAQAYGWGLYFAENPEVAKSYLNAGRRASYGPDLARSMLQAKGGDYEKAARLVRAEIDQTRDLITREELNDLQDALYYLERGKTSDGRLYVVDIPEDAELLDWDAPLSEQPEGVRDKLINLIAKYDPMLTSSDPSGEAIYQALSGEISPTIADSDRMTSEALRDAGIPGHRYLDGGSRADGDGTHNYVIYDENRIQVLQFEQRPEGEGPRGSITFPAGGLDSEQSVIRLFERADRSTFAHEAGHFFLEAFKQLATDPQAPQGMLDDFRTINEYLGRDPGDASAYTVEQQETWARSFEAYVMEGKAPSIALRSAFERFKAWLTRIYRQAVNLQVELSPEIRDVMDRMLATEEEIALVKAEQEIAPLFLERPAGMDADDYDRYRRTATEADDDASQRLMNRLMARIRLQRQKTYNAERKALAETVAEELRKTRTYQTVDRLQTGETRLSRQQIVDQFGEDALRDLSRESLGGKFAIYAKGGKDLSVMAELMGYESAVEMIDDLRTAQKFSVAVELEVKKRLDQKYGDLLTDGSIKDAARAAMHSDKRGQLLTAEANQLRKEVEQAGGPTPPVLSREAIKQQARNMIQDLTVRQAANPNAFLRAERKAAGEAQRAFSRVARAPSGRLATTGAQDLIAAHAAKRRQLLNHYLYIESRKAEELVAKMRKQATRLQKKSTREAVASPYIDQVFALLEQYDFRQLPPGQVARQESLAAFVETMRLAGREGELAIDERLIERAERTHFSTLTVDELQGLKDTLDNLEHLGRTKMKLLDAKRERNFAQVQKSVLQALDRNLPDQPQALVPRAADARRRAGQIALNTVLSADAIINRLDGSVQGVGDVWRALKEPINNGLARVQVRKQQAATDFADLFKQFYSDKERRDLNSKMLSVPEVGQSLPKQAILAIALNTGNRDNFERLTNPETPHSIPKDRVESILSTHLDERDWRFVQAVWDYIDGYWPEIAAQERALTGVNPKKVDARPYVTPYGFVKGGYFPIRYDPRLSGAVQDYDHNQMMENLKGGRFAKAQTRNGHTKERGASTGQPLRLDLGIAIAHVNDVIYDLEMRQPVQNTWRLLSDPQIDAAFKRKNASEDAEALKLWVQDVANGDRWSGSGWSAAYRHLRGGLSIAKMGFSITTLVQQPTGLLQSAVVVGKGPLAKALWKYKNNPLRNAAAVRAMSPFMEERQQTFQRDLAVLTEGMAEDPTFSRYNTFKQVMSAAAFYLIQKSQYYIVDVPTWMAAYDTELRKNGGDANAAARVADQIVARAQGSGLLSDRTAFERGTLGKDTRNVELARLMTTFGSYMMAKFSVATQRVRGTDLKNPAEFVHLLVDLLLLYTIESALAVYLTGNWPDFEDEDEDPLALFLAKETGLAVMSGLPIAREAASTLEGFGGGGTLAAAIEESAGLATGAYRMGEIAAGLEDPDRAKAAVKDVVGGMGVLFQLPTIQLERTLDGMFDNDMQFREDFTAMDLLLGQRPD